MKVGSKIVFLFKDLEGFGTAIFDSITPKTQNPSSFLSLEEPFELSLERYGVRDMKVSGTIRHFVDHQLSVLLMQSYETPVLACAVNEVLELITRENPSALPEIFAPFIVESSKLKGDSKILATSESKVPIYGVQVGPGTDLTKALSARTDKPSSSILIHYEPLACFLHLARVTNLPAFILFGERGRCKNPEDLEVLHEIGDILASTLNLCFWKDKIQWSPKGMPKNAEEPWRALYG